MGDLGYYPVKKVMKLDGYKSKGTDVFVKEIAGKNITITFDFDKGVCRKNQYQFDITDTFYKKNSCRYMKKDMLEKILNCTISKGYSGVKVRENEYSRHDWTKISRFVAHAGGCVREETYNTYYTNSLDALVENYNLGHRVFEFDFYLTSDNRLAAVHDWTQFGHCDGNALSSQEWKEFKTFGSPVTEGRYTTMLIEDLMDEMLVNSDIFIVTDSKSVEFTEEQAKLEFQLIYDAAVKRDPKLLNRVIPQMYNEGMYDMLESVYHFPSIIYTVYATQASADEVVNFSVAHDNIKVITAPVGDLRFNADVINRIHAEGLLIFNHTIQTYNELTDLKAKNIDGYYTGLLLPKDLEIYDISLRNGR